jgi:hypothetical protein
MITEVTEDWLLHIPTIFCIALGLNLLAIGLAIAAWIRGKGFCAVHLFMIFINLAIPAIIFVIVYGAIIMLSEI